MLPLLQDTNSREDEIDAALKIQHSNARLPIARIPPEILSEIFLYHRDADSSSVRGYKDRTSWTFVGNVSSHWRSVALSSPRLWSTFNLRFPRLVEQSLRYVGSTPFHVGFSSPLKGLYNVMADPEPLALTLTSICNTKNAITVVELHAERHTILQILAPILARSAHQLVVLRLELDSFTLLDTMRVPGLDSSIPNLQVLSLKCDMLPLDCVLTRSCAGSLRELTLGRCNFGKSLRALAALPLFPKLEELYMEDCFGADLNKHETIIISLPDRLSTLGIYDLAKNCIVLLARLQRPLCCTTFVRLVPQIYLGYERPPWPEDLVRHIYSTAPHSACLRFCANALRIQCATTEGLHTLELPVKYARGGGYTWQHIARVVRVALSSGSDTLRLEWAPDADDIRAENIIEVCSGAGSVCTLEIAGVGAPLNALAVCLRVRQGFLPLLATLRIEYADFTRLGTSEQAWRDGVQARRTTLKEIRLVRCTGVPPS